MVGDADYIALLSLASGNMEVLISAGVIAFAKATLQAIDLLACNEL
jgi:hypothetical protein